MNCLYITSFFNIVAGIVQTYIESWNQLLYPRVIEVCRLPFELRHDFFLHHITPKVSMTTIHAAVTEKLGYRKLCTSWVPKMLTYDHKTKRMSSALKFLTRYAQEGDEFLDYVVTGDETWDFHRTPESKQVTAMAMTCKRKSWRGSKGRRQTFMTRGYRSWFQDLINVWTMPATMLKNEVMYRQFIHSVAFVN